MPSADARVLRSDVEQALGNEGFVLNTETPEMAFWDCHFEPGAMVVLDHSQDWLLWGDVLAQLVEQGFPPGAIEAHLDTLMEDEQS